jgi:hypothetical protein
VTTIRKTGMDIYLINSLTIKDKLMRGFNMAFVVDDRSGYSFFSNLIPI